MATAAAAAKHVCISTSRFRDLVAGGVITHQPNGKYVLDKVREEYILNAQKVMAGRGAEGGQALAQQRARLATAQSERAEFANAIARGDYVSLASIQSKLEQMFAAMREMTLALPGKIADALTPHCAEDRITITEILRSECRELLEDLSTGEVLNSRGQKRDVPWTTSKSQRS